MREILITGDSPVRVIVEELGYIAANPHWAYAQKAKERGNNATLICVSHRLFYVVPGLQDKYPGHLYELPNVP